MRKCKVPFTILDQTTECNYDFSCLVSGKYKRPDDCQVDYIGDTFLFLKTSTPNPSCPYRTHFNKNQLCFCPTKIACYSNQLAEESIFKQCGHCQAVWKNYHEFLSDPDIKFLGYQESFKNLQAGIFLFNHSCYNTIAIAAEAFTHLYDGPIFHERLAGSDECPGYCLREDEFMTCTAKCECAYVKEVLQIVKNWPKKK